MISVEQSCCQSGMQTVSLRNWQITDTCKATRYSGMQTVPSPICAVTKFDLFKLNEHIMREVSNQFIHTRRGLKPSNLNSHYILFWSRFWNQTSAQLLNWFLASCGPDSGSNTKFVGEYKKWINDSHQGTSFKELKQNVTSVEVKYVILSIAKTTSCCITKSDDKEKRSYSTSDVLECYMLWVTESKVNSDDWQPPKNKWELSYPLYTRCICILARA